jgi:hypothetical protein
MSETPIALLQRAAELGLKLGSKPGDVLTVQPGERCPRDFAARLKAHKWLLFHLLRLPLIMVYSKALGETIFFCEDEDTRAALINAGASEWGIYTCDELRILCAQNRIAPLSADCLQKLHEIKRTFVARVTDNG